MNMSFYERYFQWLNCASVVVHRKFQLLLTDIILRGKNGGCTFHHNTMQTLYSTTILDRIKWEIEAPLPPIQWCTRATTKTPHFFHHWNGGRGGLYFSSILSKIVVTGVKTKATSDSKLNESPVFQTSHERPILTHGLKCESMWGS